MKKTKWKKPELIVLVRGRLEENVLITCKTFSKGMRGPNTRLAQCVNYGVPCSQPGMS